MNNTRYLSPYTTQDLNQRMLFIGGPRQVGKTTFVRYILAKHYPRIRYYNWDNSHDKKEIMAAKWPSDPSLIVLDEIHKYRKWKSWLKGEYDSLKDKHHFVVTGSAMLETYRRQGDSLFGRYHHYRMHPFSLAESNPLFSNTIHEAIEKGSGPLPFGDPQSERLAQLYKYGGFPEPFLKSSDRFLRQWHQERLDLIVKSDIRDLDQVHDIGSLILLAQLLPSRVGGLLSLNSLREDLGVSHAAISRWVQLLEMVYYAYRIYPYHQQAIRAIKKEPKLYLWDWSQIPDEGARFENMIAGHLLKFCHLLKDYGGYDAELRFLRNVDKREVDFIVTISGKPWFACEAKLSSENIDSNVHYFKSRMEIPYFFQVLLKENVDWMRDGVRVLSASKFLTGLV
jgi:predicted AAA+ superfamily ATPase